MAERFCPTCGTEVDEEARFCPSCGTILDDAHASELPAAPEWPERAPEPTKIGEASEPPPRDDADAGDEQLSLEPNVQPGGEWVDAPPAPQPPEPEPEPERGPPSGPEAQPTRPVPPPTASPPPPSGGGSSSVSGGELPLSWPTTLSGWLIGGGALLGALALLASLTDPVSLLLFLALLGVAATVFLAERMPAIPRLRLIVFSVCLVGMGVALERAGFRASGADSVLLVAQIAAAGGALLLELDRDRPIPPPAR